LDRLLVFTDGLHEVENSEGDQLGIDRVVEGLVGAEEASLEECLDGLLEKARAHSEDGEFGDDVCLLAMDVSSEL